MTHLVILLSLITAQSSVSADIEERMANETVIVSPQSPILNQSRTESEIVVEAPHSNPQPLWIDEDIVIDSAHDYQAITVATHRSTDIIYVIASRQASEGETYKLYCWYSFDGTNWDLYFSLNTPSADMINPSMNIFTTADSHYILVAYERWDTATDERNVRSYRRSLGSPTGRFIDISANSGLTEADPDLCNSDLRYPNNPWLFCAFESQDSIGFIRSTDYGLTWELRQIIGVGSANWDYRDPDIAFGWMSSPDSMFIGVAWQYANLAGPRELRFRKNTINGTPGRWRDIVYFDCPATAFDDFPTLQMTHGNYPSALIMFQRTDTVGADNRDLYRYYTDDGTETWDTAIHYNSTTLNNKPFGLGIDDTLGYYHLVFRDPAGSLRYQKARYDSLWYAWSPYTYISTGNGYSENDFPAVGVRNHQSYACWADWHSPVYKLKFDAEWLQTGIREQKSSPLMSSITITPNPSAGKMKISYQLKRPGDSKISIYNASGRMVDNQVYKNSTIGENNISLNYRHLPPGIYFVSVAIPDGIARQRVTIVK